MKTKYAAIVLTLVTMGGLATGAHGQDAAKLVVNVPYEFAAGGITLPAGKYTVGRISSDTNLALSVRSYENRSSVILLPITLDDTPADAARPQLIFEHVGDRYYLSKIQTPIGTYTVNTPEATTKVAKDKNQEAMASGGAN